MFDFCDFVDVGVVRLLYLLLVVLQVSIIFEKNCACMVSMLVQKSERVCDSIKLATVCWFLTCWTYPSI